jgi:uncharacterized protein YodC (DUF2158 family)
MEEEKVYFNAGDVV